MKDELDKFDISQSGVTFAESIINALKCRQMLDDELLIVNLLNLLRDIVNSPEFNGGENQNRELERLPVDPEFMDLLQQIDSSRYPWNEDS